MQYIFQLHFSSVHCLPGLVRKLSSVAHIVRSSDAFVYAIEEEYAYTDILWCCNQSLKSACGVISHCRYLLCAFPVFRKLFIEMCMQLWSIRAGLPSLGFDHTLTEEEQVHCHNLQRSERLV